MSDSDVSIWFPFYGRDFLLATMGFSDTEIAGYIRLLIHSWDNGGYLPEDYNSLKKISKLSNEKLERVGRLLVRSEGVLYHPKMREEHKKAVVMRAKKRAQTEAARKAKLSVTESVTVFNTAIPSPTPTSSPLPPSISITKPPPQKEGVGEGLEVNPSMPRSSPRVLDEETEAELQKLYKTSE